MFIVILSAVLGLMHLLPLETAGQGHDPARTHAMGPHRRPHRAHDAAGRDADPAARHRGDRVGVVRMAGLLLVRTGCVPVSDTARAGAGPARAAGLGEAEAVGSDRDHHDRAGREDEPTASPAVNRRVFLARASAVAAGAASVSLVGVGAASALGPPDLLHCRSACAGSIQRSTGSGSLWCRTSTSARCRVARTPSGSSG